ncbi:MAG TPA: aryl-sulfate sulfotransferase [Candidatus Xenobia bacterium]|nr:aryl-sulfate sulfotransferase [Candidatus Xenobia bacterium]
MRNLSRKWGARLFPSPVLICLLSCVLVGCAGGSEPVVAPPTNPPPQLTAISPATTAVSASPVTVGLTGSGFLAQSTVVANDMALATTFESSTQLRATIPPSLLGAPTTLSLAVSNPSPGGGISSPKIFTVLSAGQVTPTNHPQVAQYTIRSPREAWVTIEFGPTTNYGLRTWSLPTPTGGGEVSILVAGMRAFTTYHLRALVQFPDGVTYVDADHTFDTGGLPPEEVPPITVTRSSGLVSSPGVQLLDVIAGGPRGKALVTNLDGNILWSYPVANGPTPMRLLPNGNFIFIPFDGTFLREIDLAGNTVREISVPELQKALQTRGLPPVVGVLHHDVIMLPNGHLMVLADVTRQFDNLIGFEGQTINVVGDTLVELDENWQPVWTWSSFDHLDVNRHPFSGPDQNNILDWTHGNAVVYSPADRNLLLSLRHQHWVIKIDYQDGFGTGNVLWRLGPEGDFTLLNGGPADWQYAQHFPTILDNQVGVYRLALFDNGNRRVLDENGTICGLSGSSPCYSRAIIYEIDEAMKTARILWEDKPGLFAPFIGSTQVLPNGNVVWDAGTLGGAATAIVREVTQEATPQTVWQLELSGQFVYRSIRLPSLYPGVQW